MYNKRPTCAQPLQHELDEADCRENTNIALTQAQDSNVELKTEKTIK